jgi:hypothetical protein
MFAQGKQVGRSLTKLQTAFQDLGDLDSMQERHLALVQMSEHNENIKEIVSLPQTINSCLHQDCVKQAAQVI